MSSPAAPPALPRSLLALARDTRGVSAVEFALVLPVLLLLSLGFAEVGRYALVALKVQHAATTLADLATREEQLSAGTLDGLFAACRHILAPFDMATDGVAIVTGVGAEGGGGPEVLWQRSGGGALTAASDVGGVGGAADLPDVLTVDDGETLVAAEVVFSYRPWLLGVVPAATLRRTAYYRPRAGTLRQLD